MHSVLVILVSGASLLSGLWSPMTTVFALREDISKFDLDIHTLCLMHDGLPSFLHLLGLGSKNSRSGQVTLFDLLGLDPTKAPFYPVVESIRPNGKTWKEARQALHETALFREEVFEDFNKTDEWKNPRSERASEFLYIALSMNLQETAHEVLADEERRVLYQVGFLPLMERPGSLEQFCAERLAGKSGHHEL